MTVYLETERLVLRRFTEEDAERLGQLDGDRGVMRHVGPHGFADVAAHRDHIRTAHFGCYAETSEFGFRAADARAGGEFLGWFHLRPALKYLSAAEAGCRDGGCDLGVRLRQPAWGRGSATEGARALVRRAFTERNVPGVVAVSLAACAASCRVPAKAGLKLIRRLRPPGFDRPVVTYPVNREEFTAVSPGGSTV